MTLRRFLPSLIGALVILLAFLIPIGILTAESPAQSPNQTPFICIDDAGLLSFCDTPSPTETPMPTWTLTATHTPVVTATLTSVPSATPTPATATPEPTPTMETTLPPTQPTMTPTPSMTPTPDLSVCYATVQVNLRLRDAPVTGATIGFWAPGDRVIVYASEFVYFPDNPEREDEWSDVSDLSGVKRGWSAGLYNFNLYMRYDTTQICLETRFPDPGHNAALLWHTVPSFNIGNARVSYEILRDKDIEFGLKTYASLDAALDALNRGGTSIYRHGAPDCPNGIGTDDPRQSARDFLRHGQAARDNLAGYEKAYYEPFNECLYGNNTDVRYLHWWAIFLDEYFTLHYAISDVKLVGPTLGPGYGEPAMWIVWKPALELNASHGGLFGEHAYAPIPNCGGDGSLAQCDPYCACRHRTNETDRQSIGLDIDVAITEAARGFGNDPVEVEDMCAWYEIVRFDEWLQSVSLWTMGPHPTWPNANLDNYVVSIAQCVQ